MTAGFTAVRQAGESVSVMLLLEDGQIAWAIARQSSIQVPEAEIPFFWRMIIYRLYKAYSSCAERTELVSFKELAEEIDSLINPDTGRP